MCNLSVIRTQPTPEIPQKYVKSIKPEASHSIQQRVQVLLEPPPEIPSRDTLRGRGRMPNSLLDAGEVREGSYALHGASGIECGWDRGSRVGASPITHVSSNIISHDGSLTPHACYTPVGSA